MSGKLLMVLMILTATLILVITASGWIRMPLTSDRLNQYFLAAYPEHDVQFETGWLTWKPVHRTVELHLQGVSVLTGSREMVALVPSVLFEIEPFSILRGAPQAQFIHLEKPQIWLGRTADGAFNVSIGPAGRAKPASLASIILRDLARFRPDVAPDRVIPEIRLHDARLTLTDDSSGASLAFDPVSLVIDTIDESVRAEAMAQARTLGETLDVSLTADLDRSDGTMRIHVEFGNVNPAILSQLLPSLRMLNPIETALHGKAVAVLNADLSLRSATMSVHGGRGSLEVAQYSGRNVAFQHLRADMSNAHDTGAFEISDISIDLALGRLTGTLSSTPASSGLLRLRGDLVLNDNSWRKLMPTWFSALDRLDTGSEFHRTREGISQRLRFEANLDGDTLRLQGRGDLDLELSNVTQLSTLKNLYPPYPATIPMFIDGTLANPRISFGTQ